MAIGISAGNVDHGANSIVIHTTGASLSGGNTNVCYIKPIRGVSSPTGYQLYYDEATDELMYYKP